MNKLKYYVRSYTGTILQPNKENFSVSMCPTGRAHRDYNGYNEIIIKNGN